MTAVSENTFIKNEINVFKRCFSNSQELLNAIIERDLDKKIRVYAKERQYNVTEEELELKVKEICTSCN